MNKFHLIAVSLYLLALLPHENVGFNIYTYFANWRKKPECASCFKSADVDLFKNLLTLNPTCDKGKDAVKAIGSVKSTFYFHIKRICKKNFPKEYDEALKNLENEGKKGFEIFSNKCKPEAKIMQEKKGEIQGWINIFQEATKTCKDFSLIGVNRFTSGGIPPKFQKERTDRKILTDLSIENGNHLNKEAQDFMAKLI